MVRRIGVIICIYCLSVLSLQCQTKSSAIEQFIADIFEQFAAESEEELDFESFYESLIDLSDHPINLNNTNKEELSKLMFLSDIQIENFLYFTYRFGKLNSLYELQLVDGFDMTDIRRMLPFVSIGSVNSTYEPIYWKEVVRYGKNQVLARFDKTLETKDGYLVKQNAEGQDTKDYIGNSLYNSLKYQFRFKERIKMGVTLEKDAGELWINKKRLGYDYNSAYLQINDFKYLKTVVLGDYRATFGQGLVLGASFGMGKSSYVLNVGTHGTGLKKYSSTNEQAFFRGVGATLKFDNFNTSFFYSRKYIDADSTGNVFSGFYKTGYHRTESEILKKQTVLEQVIGFNATYTFKQLQVGFTGVYTHFDHSLDYEPITYNHYYFRGQNQAVGGLYYRFRWMKLNFFGESALTDIGALATINGMSFSPLSQLSFLILNRNYSADYDTFYANSFSESTRINNENGWYFGAEFHPYRKWKISAYCDSYRFKWPKYGVDAPSLGTDYLLQIDFAQSRTLSMFWRMKYEDKMDNFTESSSVMPFVVNISKAVAKYQLNYSFGNFSFRNVIDFNLAKRYNLEWKYGLTVYQDISYEFKKLPLKIDLRYQFFDALDYENRVYAYERDILYAFAIPMFYGKGNRYYVNLKYEINSKLSLWFKIAQTVYADDRESISSANEEILGNRKTDLRTLIRWNF